MVVRSGEAGGAQRLRHRLGLLPRAAVDDGAPGTEASGQPGLLARRNQRGGPLGIAAQRLHREGQVRAPEVAAHLKRVAHVELRDDLVHHLRSRGGGEGGRRGAHQLAQLAQPQVLGPEVVPPLANAVSFVDGEERDRHPLEQAAKAGQRRSLGRNVEDLEVAAQEGAHHRRCSSSSWWLFSAAAIAPLRAARPLDPASAR